MCLSLGCQRTITNFGCTLGPHLHQSSLLEVQQLSGSAALLNLVQDGRSSLDSGAQAQEPPAGVTPPDGGCDEL